VKPFSTLAALVFALIAILQLLRFVMRWDVVVNGTSIPLWASAVAFNAAGGLAVMVWREAQRKS
jgi:hypothetical protein